MKALHRVLPAAWQRRGLLAIALLPLAAVFGLLASLRRGLYRRGWLASVGLPVPVVVVGNITVGGSGKTPAVLWLAQRLVEAGWHPAILSRGYGAPLTAPREAAPGADPGEVGDEPALLARRAPCPVWVGPDRVAAARALLAARPEVDVIVCDDGLQHYRLKRDVEVVVFDRRGCGNGWLLPAGPLREPLSRVRGADCVIANGELPASLRAALDALPVSTMRLSGQRLRRLGNEQESIDPAQLRGKRVHAAAGIGDPQRFFDHLRGLGLDFVSHPFPDHHRFSASDLAFPDAQALLMTEKDGVKCAPFAPRDTWVLRVDAEIEPDPLPRLLEILHGRKTA